MGPLNRNASGHAASTKALAIIVGVLWSIVNFTGTVPLALK